MAETIRQQIVSAVIAALENISTANGYETDIGATVLDFPRNVQGTYNASELPVVGVFDVEGRSSKGNLNSRKTDREITMQVRCYVRSATPGTEIRKILGDLETAIGIDQQWGGLAIGTMPTREGVVIESEDFEISAAVIEFVIHYASCVFNPYE